MPEQSARELAAATNQLSQKVQSLSDKLEVSHEQARRSRVLARGVLGLAILTMAGLVASVVLLFSVRDSVDQNEANQVTNCNNANESRLASFRLWTFIIDASLAGPDVKPEAQVLLRELKDYVAEVYRQHDCSDLNKQYPQPDLPQIPTPNAA